ncbi:PREDICTED: angio-associated migratory cell protein [Papilio xuthus]|uniref:Angio-associated migratory cell protein n=1 Tax=Papilio xuthus TaxID=66420 RepID=A0AAJ7E9R7_PAPXU|nr:PREDICTED: angio-associated migratory cell protein [Papilio xuthus]
MENVNLSRPIVYIDTPPSSISGDEINGMEDLLFLEEVADFEEVVDNLDELSDQEEEDVDMEVPADQSILAFNKHQGSVFCCNLHPDGKFAVTGGEDDKAYVWSTETGEIVTECTGHKDSVIFVGFSFDGAFLASVDMSGVIKVWKCNFESTQEWPVAFEYEAGDLIWGLWHFGTRVLICGAVSGDIFVFKIPSGDTKILPGHNVKTECGKLFSDGVRLVSGYEDGTVKVWDLKTNSVLHQVPPNVHHMRVTDVDTHPENNIMASISTDGKAVLTTSMNGKVVAQLETDDDLETVAFSNPQLGFLALGTLNGSVSIWDAGRQMMRHYCSKKEDGVSAGVTKIFWINDQLVTGCLDGSIRIYDGRSGERILMLTGHWLEIFDMCYNEKQNILLSTSDDGTARVFKYEARSENVQ